MSDKLFNDDLADLLGDNSSNNKQTKSRRGDFLGALKRNNTTVFGEKNKENVTESLVTKETPPLTNENTNTLQSYSTKQMQVNTSGSTNMPDVDSQIKQTASTSDGISSYFSRRRNTSQLVDNNQSDRSKPHMDPDSKILIPNVRNEQDLPLSKEHVIKSKIKEEEEEETLAIAHNKEDIELHTNRRSQIASDLKLNEEQKKPEFFIDKSYYTKKNLDHQSERTVYTVNSDDKAMNEKDETIMKLKEEIFQNETFTDKKLQTELNIQKNSFLIKLEENKKFYEAQITVMKKQIDEKLNINNLAKKLENSNFQIEEIMQKIFNEKNESIASEKFRLDSREKYIINKEENLRQEEKKLFEEKEKFIDIKKNFEEEKSNFEKIKINYELECRMKYDQLTYETKRENEFLKIENEKKSKNFEESIKLFNEEKKLFEKNKESDLKEIKQKTNSFDERRLKYLEEETEIKTSIKYLQEKENFINKKISEFEQNKTFLEEKERKTEKDRRDLMVAAKRIEEGIKNLEEKNKIFEKEKSDVIKIYQQCENEKNILNLEKMKVEQMKQELKYRIHSIDNMTFKYQKSNEVLQGTSFNNISYQNNWQPVNNNFTKSNMNENISTNFNADEYFKNLQNKLNKRSQSQNVFFKNENLANRNTCGDFINEELENLRKIKMELENSYFLKNNFEMTSKNENNSDFFLKEQELGYTSQKENIGFNKFENVKKNPHNSFNYTNKQNQNYKLPVKDEFSEFEEIISSNNQKESFKSNLFI